MTLLLKEDEITQDNDDFICNGYDIRDFRKKAEDKHLQNTTKPLPSTLFTISPTPFTWFKEIFNSKS